MIYHKVMPNSQQKLLRDDLNEDAPAESGPARRHAAAAAADVGLEAGQKHWLGPDPTAKFTHGCNLACLTV